MKLANTESGGTPIPPAEKDKIQIMMSEYTALRSEIVSRTGYGFQVLSFGLATLTWFLQQPLHGHPWYYWAIIVCVIVAFALAIFVNVRDLTRAANGVKQLEHEVNCRAGDYLLVWEMLSGVLTKRGIIPSFFSMMRPSSRSELPPLDSSYRRPAPVPQPPSKSRWRSIWSTLHRWFQREKS